MQTGPNTSSRYACRLGEDDDLAVQTLKRVEGDSLPPVRTGTWTITGKRAQEIYGKPTR